MLALITGKTLVKGQSGKEVNYIGSVQTDGYIYFNDERFYRATTNGTLGTEEEINLENVQQWYTQQNRWIRSNVFTDLKAIGFDIDEILQQIDDAANQAIQAIEDAASAAKDALDVNTKMLHNGTVLLHVANTLNQVISIVNSQHQQSIQQITDTIYTDGS